jgi:Skp family chaperone for outer membrane proteins
MEAVFKESESNKRELIGIDELRKDRDARIGALRKEIDELTLKFEQTENLNAALEV